MVYQVRLEISVAELRLSPTRLLIVVGETCRMLLDVRWIGLVENAVEDFVLVIVFL